ncbi:MAG: Holliday junction resolvase RuvX [Deltaproteobacteria bacterium]
MRLMGLDLGEKTIGISVSDELGLTAQPRTTLKRISKVKDIACLLDIAKENSVTGIVVGMPINMDGSRGEAAKKAEGFISRLQENTSLPVISWDERLSTAAVTRVLVSADMSRAKRKAHVDKLAAAYILQGYLDSLKSVTPYHPPFTKGD